MKATKRQRALLPFVILLGLVNAGAALADATSFKVPLTGAQGVPPVDTAGSGTAELHTTRRPGSSPGLSLTVAFRAHPRWLTSMARPNKAKMPRP